MNRKLTFRIVLVIIVAFLIYRFYTNQPEYTMTFVNGQTMGTIPYNVKYLGDDEPNYKVEIDSILVAFNQSLSTYIPDSEISTLNTTGALMAPSVRMLEVLEASRKVYETTDGAFDPTVGPLVNAWGFGPDKRPDIPDSGKIDSLRALVGFGKVDFSKEKVSVGAGVYLDFSAIAKGYAVDLVAEFLENKGFSHYMVEIGGEVRARGQNEQNEFWSIGIENPLVAREERKLLAIVRLKNRSMATSGNYRNFYQFDGRTIAHTIDPRTGYNTSHNLLSASVFANTCMEADAYATAFMVLGPEAAQAIIEASDLEAYLVYTDAQGSLRSYVSKGLAKFVTLNNAPEGEDS